ncbi:hypothetical protein AALO_G00096320 [Alosa alosa]|uniref:Secreted protein n=1 Tax=Alosa alosa TaxID=278164 RepID=A0AAV6GTJ4_9TELE|nr:hypothetical protein AALO_G00096320 [Alosa alosa]
MLTLPRRLLLALSLMPTSAGHSIADLRFLGVERISRISPKRRGGDLDKTLLQRECFWIFELGSLCPKGMNEDLNLSCFL